jgi:hypothetical protein
MILILPSLAKTQSGALIPVEPKSMLPAAAAVESSCAALNCTIFASSPFAAK